MDATLFIYAASLLSVFHIEQDGQEKQREYTYSQLLVRWMSFLASLSTQGNKRADSFLAVRTRSRAPSPQGTKRRKSLFLQMLWRNDFLSLAALACLLPFFFSCRVYVKVYTARSVQRVQVISGLDLRHCDLMKPQNI